MRLWSWELWASYSIFYFNLEKINDSYVLKKAERLNDPARQNEQDKVLIAIPVFADLYNYFCCNFKKNLNLKILKIKFKNAIIKCYAII